jgi:hypothetical protein
MPSPQVGPEAIRKRWFHLSFKDILKVGTSAFIPLMIGVFTLVLAFQQHRLGMENCENDLNIAKIIVKRVDNGVNKIYALPMTDRKIPFWLIIFVNCLN